MRRCFALSLWLILPVWCMAAPDAPAGPAISTCGPYSPVIVAAAGATAQISIGAEVPERKVCATLFKSESGPPTSGKRRILISKARLEPMPHFFLLSHGRYPNDLAETATIQVTLINITSVPILITGANMNLDHAGPVRTPAGSWGIGVLSASHGTSARILLQPGEAKDVSLDRAVRLRGLARVLPELAWMKTATIFDDDLVSREKPPMLADLRMLPEFNDILAALFGRGARIGITVFEGDHSPVARADIPLANGVDYFYKGVNGGTGRAEQALRFDHSAFLAQAMLDFRRNGAGRGKEPVEPQAPGAESPSERPQ